MATSGKIVRVVIKAEDQISNVFRRIQRQLDRLERATGSTASTISRMGSTATTQYSRVSQGISNATRNQNQYAAAVTRSLSPLKQLTDAAKSLAVTYLGMNAAESMIATSDAVTLATARLELFKGNIKDVNELTKMIYDSAQRSRGSYLDMMDLVSKYSAVASDKFGGTENVVAFTETLQKMFTVSGATGQEIYSAALQLKQALGTGRLMGEEFRAVSEAAPLYTQAIAEYMTGIGKWGEVGIGDLKKLASESQITSDIMIGAMFAASDDINKKFADMPYTFGQTWTMMKNTVVRSLDEVWKKLTSLLSNGDLDKFMKAFGGAIVAVATVMVWVFSLAVKIFNFIADNWSIIAPIVWGIVAAIAAYNAVLLVLKIINIVGAAITFMRMAATYGLVGALAAQIAAQLGVNAVTATYIAMVLIIVGIVIAIIALIYIVIAVINKLTGKSISATGVIIGVITTAVAIVWNLFLAILDLVLMVINHIVNGWVMFANFFGNVFRDPIASVIHLFGDLADRVLGIIESIAKAMDKVFGSNMAKSVKGWRDGLKSKVEIAANKYGNGSYEKVANELNLSSESLGLSRWAYGDAWDTGYNFGQGIDDKVGSMFGGLDSLGSDVGSWEDFANQYGIGDIAGDVGDIADNTALSSEDLKYLRQLATQRAVNKFTTAEIRIDMQNSNTINGTQDIDGIVKSLEEKLYESMSIAAEGVHI